MTRKRKEDFSNFVAKILRNSMLTGIPQIAAAGNWPKRIVRTLVFFMCVGGFIYQSLSFMNLYWEYDVVMDVRVENPMYDVRPSITICNWMGFKMQDFCSRREEPEVKKLIKENEAYCWDDLDVILGPYVCNCMPRFCDRDGHIKNMSIMNYDKMAFLPRETLKKWLLTPEEIILECFDYKTTETLEAYCSDDYYLQPSCQNDPLRAESCVTLNSLVGRPNHTLEKVITDGEIRMQLNTWGENYDETMRDPLLAISIHNPYTILNPFVDGFMLEKGRQYSFRIKKIVKNLLPPPYKTNCMDYRSLWHARGGHGPTNLKECIEECRLNLSLAKYGCVLKEMHLPNEERRCSDDINDDSIYLEAISCAKERCRPACYEEYYTIEHNSWDASHPYCKQANPETKEDSIIVYIHFNGMETTIYTYSPKYQDIEAFSYLGGYVGMWLGISLVAVFDFLETVVVMMKYPLRRWARFKQRRRQINEIQKFQHRY